MKPLIGITSGTIYNREHPHEPFSYGQKHDYIEAISEAGGIPVIIPISRNSQETKEVFERIDGFLFAGGDDISPALYGEEARDIDDIDEARDQHEAELMKLVLETHKPVFAICRGMQLLNIVRGGTLYQDIAKEIPNANNHVGYLEVKDPKYLAHTLSIVPDSKLAEILEMTEIKSNTRHHQAVKAIGKGLRVNAHAEDGIIEGIEDMSEGYIMAVQPHPESIVDNVQPEWKPLFESFITAARKT